jgi:hypothetical protein
LKYIKKVVSFYNYQATGISVLAGLASREDPRVLNFVKKIQRNIKYYKENIFKTDVDGNCEGRVWDVPLRRLLLHLALAYRKLESALSSDEKHIRTNHKYAIQYLTGFSSCTQDNKAETIKPIVFEWKNKLAVEFKC